MPVPAVITDLAVAAATNSPAGTEAVTTSTGPDEYFRAHAAIVRRLHAKGADVASAATVDLGAINDGSYVKITGTTTITNFGTIAAGVERTLLFADALTLTHDVTKIILPGGVNIVTAAGDVFVFVSEGAGLWRCKTYQLATGGPLNNTVITAKIADGAVTTVKVAYDAVTYAKIQNVSATDKVLGRVSAGAGDIEEIACTPFARTLLDDADAATARATLGAAPAVAEASFRAYQSTTQAVAAATFTKVLFQTEDYDTGGNFANSTFTAPAAGVYMFTCAVHAALEAGERAIVMFYVNGARHSRAFDFATSLAANGSATGSALIKLAAADTVDAYVYYTVAEDTITGSEVTHFSGCRIG